MKIASNHTNQNLNYFGNVETAALPEHMENLDAQEEVLAKSSF